MVTEAMISRKDGNWDTDRACRQMAAQKESAAMLCSVLHCIHCKHSHITTIMIKHSHITTIMIKHSHITTVMIKHSHITTIMIKHSQYHNDNDTRFNLF